MHYYPFHIADFTLHTTHLTLEEEAVYRRLLDYYYDKETPIPRETKPVIRRLRLDSYADIVGSILEEFFVLEADGWHNLRADIVIQEYNEKAEKARQNGKKGGRPKKNLGEKTELVNLANQEETGSKANQELKTITKTNTIGDKSPRLPHCPHQDIVDLYHRALTAMPQVRVMTEARKRQLISLWKQHPELDWWSRYFDYCAKSDFLCGRADGKPGKPPFVADLEWITKPSNHAKIVEGKYHHQGEA